MKKIVPLLGLVLGAGLTCSLHAQPFGYPEGGGPYNRPPAASGTGFRAQRSVRFQQRQDEKGYHLHILTHGYSPEAIQVNIDGPYLVVANKEAHRIENRHQRGYSFTSSSSSMRRRFRLPMNADIAAMKRVDVDGEIVITLPYR